jgi:prepilin-type N-terminal cleavage/methylation domain-containing protein
MSVLGARGMTMIEILVASVVAAVVAGGTMAGFIAAARMTRAQSNTQLAEAAGFAQESLEKNRNMIACDSPWFNVATCTPAGGMPTVWMDDPIVGGAGTDSIVNGPGAQRRFCMIPRDCDGDAVNGDCFEALVRVCWNNTVCPAVGAACP